MTQETYDQIEYLWANYHILKFITNDVIIFNSFRQKYLNRRMTKLCDHIYPNNTSGIDKAFACAICGNNV